MLCQSPGNRLPIPIDSNCLGLYWDLRRFTFARTKSEVITLLRRFSNRFANRDDRFLNAHRFRQDIRQDTLAARGAVWFDRRFGVRRRGVPF
jgi:hypothetical protein